MKVVLLGLVLALLAIMFTAATMQRHSVAAIENGSVPKASLPAVSQHVASPAQRLAVAFRLDPALTRSLYLGDRWVSPPSFYFAQPGTQYVVHAKAQVIDSHGERTDLSGDWTTNDPEMVAITRHDYGEVTIVVRRPGESNLTVSAGGESKVLRVRARQTDDAITVEIAQ